MMPRYFLKTFGCQQNVADSERIAAYYISRGFSAAKEQREADVIVINTCVVRERAAEKVFGLIRNLEPLKEVNPSLRFVITGCLIGAASREPSGKMMKALRNRLPDVDFLPLEEVGFEYAPVRQSGRVASIPISNGCNNFCTYCIVPFSRGKERSRDFSDILREVKDAVSLGKTEILLLGQNVNSYGADFFLDALGGRSDRFQLPDGREVRPTMVKHLGRHRIPTLFPFLLETVAKEPGVSKVSFLSSNPWDFSEDLIEVIRRFPNIDRTIHLPVQSGSDRVLQAMNRWYTREEYLSLLEKIRHAIPEIRFTTDIIVGFPGETESEFEETLDLARRAHFEKAYIAWYSPRPGTGAFSLLDDISLPEKKRRRKVLDLTISTEKI
ncbi:MAG: MiaB/RimO family radical SAM methylthiotransferase [Candidatus Moraniibacteriota bacterium]|nr:MAG: MiaB/RimO family radical SAM methylthiotransferase [Candidatus Moranbacteria bacterium]